MPTYNNQNTREFNISKSTLQTITKPRVEARAGQPYVYIPIELYLHEMDKANELVVEIFGWLGRKGVHPNGAPFYRYWTIGDTKEKFKLEVGVPIAGTTFGDDRVISGTIPTGKYATLVHNGHPDLLSDSFAILEEWARDRDIKWDIELKMEKEVWGGRFEYYLTDPVAEPNLNKWTTEIAYLIK
ncbi:GyrI-like domain-containing protein [Sporosarcina sp. G11-34]|uniref:GyrI-like domain-containing protein n=1 Tax=Sporosarcina sp. G11-34 TaxID=2849605 RepID=UPI0022A8D507|nr:GyrI-like domain-containing protein [Sporosarcina sp. G11-34]MCZ2257892.1 GyrI-like domain-containing protein [Sporosarcina sp. G11-34]